jgi:uncharacterized protein (TIGR00661 family)
MKILYGVQGTGNGHISRSRKMAAHLSARGADVTFLLSGRPRDKLFDMECFGNFEHRRGLTMVQVDGKVDYLRTTLETPALQFVRDVRALDVNAFDIVITDFEPVTAWAAKLAGKTCIGIGHQYAFGHSVPRKGGNPIGESVLRHFAPANIGIGLHWHHFNTAILPPIIDTRLAHQESNARFVLVYLPFEEQSKVTALLNRFDDCQFIQYSPDVVDGAQGNVQLRKTNLHGFRNDLQHASAVLCNAGFELVAECLHIGTPVLVKPVQGQMEQVSNAFALRTLNWGSTLDTLDAARIGEWLQSPPRSPGVRYPDVAAALTDWILEGEWADQSDLWETLWACARERAAA